MKKVTIIHQIPIFLFVFIYFTNLSNGQNLYSLNNTQDFCPSGNTNISLQENPTLPNFNDSLLNWMINFMFKPSSLGFSEIKQTSATIAINMFQGSTITSGINYFGFDLFNEFSVNTSYAKNFGKLWIGANLSYNRITVKDFNSENLLKIDIFGKLNITENFNLGFYLDNLNRSHFSNYDKTIYQNLTISLGTKPFNYDSDVKIKMAVDIGTNLSINRNSNMFFSTLFNFYNLVNLKTKIISKPLIVINGVSITLVDWLNIAVLLRYQQNFNYDQTLSTELYW